MELYSLPDNPVPDGAVVSAVVASDGVRLRAARWPALAEARGTVALFPGRGEAIEKHFETVADLRKRGFAVAVLDWRGQGGSDRRLRNRRKGHVDSFDEYDRDLEAFAGQVVLADCPAPHFAVAHSTGSLVCLRAASRGRAPFARMLLASPLLGLGPSRTSPRFSYRAAALFTAIGLGEMRLPASRSPTIDRIPFDGNPLTSDPVRFARAVAIATQLPAVAVGAPTYGWLYAACRAMEEAAEPEFAPTVKVPLLMVSGSLDVVVSLPAIELLASELRSGAQVVIPGARHELMMERDSLRSQFFAAFDAFIPGS